MAASAKRGQILKVFYHKILSSAFYYYFYYLFLLRLLSYCGESQLRNDGFFSARSGTAVVFYSSFCV